MDKPGKPGGLGGILRPVLPNRYEFARELRFLDLIVRIGRISDPSSP